MTYSKVIRLKTCADGSMFNERDRAQALAKLGLTVVRTGGEYDVTVPSAFFEHLVTCDVPSPADYNGFTIFNHSREFWIDRMWHMMMQGSSLAPLVILRWAKLCRLTDCTFNNVAVFLNNYWFKYANPEADGILNWLNSRTECNCTWIDDRGTNCEFMLAKFKNASDMMQFKLEFC